MLNRLIKRLQRLTAKLNNFSKWGLSKAKIVGVIFAISRVEKQIENIKKEEKPMIKKQVTMDQFLVHVCSILGKLHPSKHISLYNDTKKDYMRIKLPGCDYIEVTKNYLRPFEIGKKPMFNFKASKYLAKERRPFAKSILGLIKEESAKFEIVDFRAKSDRDSCGYWHDEDGNIVDPSTHTADAVAFY